MPNYGATHSARGDLNTIRNNLLEGQQQQTGLMFILKEIVQNADDCKATRLSIGRSEGLPTATHPLLQGPAIVAVNDGPFSKQDTKGIRAIGLSTKENDSSAVGKFGQGLKTVFLLCEAFFYLSGPKRDDGVEPRSILNLWYTEDEDDDVPRAAWDSEEFSQADHDLMNDELQRMGIGEGFTIWIPLRLKRHCQRGNYTKPIAIVPRYFDDEPEWLATEFQSELAHELAELLPLLKRVKHIQVYDGQTLQEVRLGDKSQQCWESFDRSSPDREASPQGVIDACTNHPATPEDNALQRHFYYGYQALLHQERLLSLKASDDWPTVIPTRWDTETAEKQKAESHHAVVLHVRPLPAGTSKLTIRWAVFLPTAEMPDGAPITEISLTTPDQEAAYHYVLTLHGFFFLQGDRRRIRDWSSDGSKNGVLQDWNQILAEQGTLRLLLPTLEDFARERSPQTVKVLTQALATSKLYKTYQQHICAEGVWLSTLYFNEQPNPLQWCFLSTVTSQNILTVPESTFERLPEIFPTLAEVCQNCIITFKEWPCLASSDYRPQAWSPEDISLLIQGVTQLKAVEICRDSDNVEVLYTFLTHALPSQQISISAVIQPLTELIRNAFLDESFQPADNLSKLVAKLPSQQILGLPSNLPETLYTRLLHLSTECLLVPENLAPSNELPQLSEQNTHELLNTLVSEVSKSKTIEQFAIKLFNQVKSPTTEIWQQICRLDLFRVSKIGTDENSPEFKSFDWVTQMQSENCIFSDREERALARSLAAALQQPIFFLHTQIEKHHLQVSNCTISSILSSWISQPQPPLLTQSAEKRVRLLQEILKLGLIRSDTQKVARYLLHASPAQFENINETLYPEDHQSAQLLWSRVLSHLLGNDQSWKFVGGAFLEVLTPQARQSLHIQSVDSEGITTRLQELRNSSHSLNSIDWSIFSREELEDIIYKLPIDLLRELRIHEPLHWEPGQPLVAIDGDSYLEPSSNDFPIRPALAEVLGVTLIKRCYRSQDIAQKQGEISPPISAKDIVKRILRRSDQAEYWQDIMEALKRRPEESIAIENLRSSSWLPLEAMQDSKAPEDVIHLSIKEIQDVLEHIFRKSNSVYIASSQLSQQVRDHEGFKILRDKLFPSRKEALKILTDILIYDPQYYVGSLAKIINGEDALSRWLSAFNQVSDKVMPAHHILNALKKNEALELFGFLAEPIAPPTRVVEILNFLVHQYRHSERGDARASVLDVYKQYLSLASNNIDIISQIYLLSQAGEWQMAKNLCIGESIAPQYVLHKDLQGIITTPSVIHSSTEVSGSEISFDDLVTYFESWPHRTRKAIGILLCILSGSNSGLRNLSCQYLQDVDRYLECLHLRDQNGAKFRNTIQRSIFNVTLNRTSQRQVTSLAGTPLTVQILQDSDNLIVGQYKCIKNNEYELTFQVVSIEDADRLITILKNAFQYIVEAIYGYEILDFDGFWNKVNLTGIDIRIARHMLLDSGILSLRSQINPNLGASSEIVSLIREYSELQKRKTKLEILGTANILIEDINKKLIGDRNQPGIRDQIGELLCNSLEAQNLFLNAVKEKISNASYDRESILFELFQNADDAYCELNNIGGGTGRHDIKIGYSYDRNELWISHWGRRINQDRCGNQVSENHGYDDDLIKMLLLNFSDKAEGVTGKFGLGFKSVFLAADRPKIVSGTLGLEVIGAVYPRELTREEFDTIERHYLNNNADQGTTIVLPEVNLSTAQSIISVFKESALYLTAFSRWLKTITITDVSGESNFEWSERRIQGLNGQSIYYGNGESYDKPVSTLLLGDATRRCLLGLDTKGFTPLPKECPTFWVTTPTRMFLDVGIAVNAPFHPDIGRSQLDLSGGGYETNKVLAQELGREFGQALVQLFHTDHEVILRELQLKSDLSPLDLWTSLWDTLAKNLAGRPSSDKGIELVHNIFWSKGCGLRYLYEKCNALPTGIVVDKFNCLTQLSKIRWSPDGILSQNPDALAKVLEWPILKQGDDKVIPGQLISQKYAEVLESFGYSFSQKKTLLEVLKQQLNSYKASVEDGRQIGQLISKEFIASLDEPEQTDVKKFLQGLHFEARNGEWRPAKDLLTHVGTQDNFEENLLSQFAPSSSLLSEAYQLRSLDFFYACRITQPFDVKKASQWILNAQTSQHKACIRYLVTSKNRSEVIVSIRSKVHSTWLKYLIEHRSSSQKEYEVSPYKFDALLYELGLLKEENYRQSSSDTKEPSDEPPTEDKIQEALNQILRHWKNNKSRLLKKYEESIYLREDLKLTKNNFSDSSDETKRRWLFLFMRAVLHSMGQTNFDQHKQFLRLCEDWEWMDVMALETPRESDWLNLLNKYFSRNRIGSNLPYYQWVRYYPAFYAISKWWYVYRDSLLESNNQYIRFNPSGREIKASIDLILNPQNNPIFQGTGIGHDAPPIGSILGMGSTFVIRELLRADILTNQDLVPFAYVPSQNVREKLLRIGCKPFDEKSKPIQHSQHIYSFLKKHLKDDAIFEGGYDLPILYHENA